MNESQETEIGRLPEDVELIELGRCIDLIIDHRGKTPKKLGSDWVSTGIKAISAKNVHSGTLSNQDEIRYVTYEVYKKWMKEDVKKGDCLLASEGATLGEHLYWDFDFPVVLSQRLFCIRANCKVLYPKFFYAFMTSGYFQNQIHGRASGTSVFGLRQTEVLKMLVPMLPMEIQTFIGDFHYSINKKIDLIRRQNATLETIAETIFRQWFVEEAGEKWGELKVSHIADHLKASTSPSKQPAKLFHHYSIPAFDQGQNPIEELGKEILSIKFQVAPSTILVSKLNPRFPRIWAIGTDVKENSICSTEFQIFKPKKKSLFAFLYFLLKSENAKNALQMAASGTSGSHQRVRPEDISNISFILPKIDLAEQFSSLTQSYLDKINQNKIQIQTLTKFRDTLLPKLMSGEIKIHLTL
jgi:restriction endonuclease S subunit